jgi:hypothetical protein
VRDKPNAKETATDRIGLQLPLKEIKEKLLTGISAILKDHM